MTGQDGTVGAAEEGRINSRPGRLVASAVSPIQLGDFAAGALAQARGTGRERFTGTLASYFDAEQVTTYTSFRRALGASLQLLSQRSESDADTVLVPAYCSSDFAAAISGAGLSVRRYDVDPETLAADTDSLADCRMEDALAIVAVNVLGYSSRMDDLASVASDASIRLVEAIGYSIGSEYRGQRLGTFGDLAVLNFQQGKPIPVGGGAVVSQDPALTMDETNRSAVDANHAVLAGYKLFSHPRAYGLYANVAKPLHEWLDGDGSLSTHPEPKLDVAYEPPFATMSDFQCGIATRLFRRLDDYRRARARTAEFYATELADLTAFEHLRPVDGLTRHQYVRYPLLVARPDLRSDVQTALAELGIETAKLYNWPKVDASLFPGAATIQQRLVTLPTHPYVDEQDRRLIVQRLRRLGEAAVSNGPGGL